MKEKANTKSMIISIVIIVLGLLVFAGIVYYSLLYTKENPPQFERTKKNVGEKMYKEIMSYDFEKNYPETPEALMELHNEMVLLMYGKIVVDNTIIEEVVQQQRKLWSEDLLASTDESEQLSNILESTKKMYEVGAYTRRLVSEKPFYGEGSKDSCIVTVTRTDHLIGETKWDYYLELDTYGKWKIMYWAKGEDVASEAPSESN